MRHFAKTKRQYDILCKTRQEKLVKKEEKTRQDRDFN